MTGISVQLVAVDLRAISMQRYAAEGSNPRGGATPAPRLL